MVEGAEARTRYEEHGELERGDEIDDVALGVDGDEEAAGALDDDGAVAQALPGGEGGVPVRLSPEATRGDAGSDRSAEAVGAELLHGELAARGGA